MSVTVDPIPLPEVIDADLQALLADNNDVMNLAADAEADQRAADAAGVQAANSKAALDAAKAKRAQDYAKFLADAADVFGQTAAGPRVIRR